MKDDHSAEQLLYQLSPYLPEAHSQAITPSPFLRTLDPSPWEVLTQSLTSAVLSLGQNHPFLRQKVIDVVRRYVDGWSDIASSLVPSQVDSEGWDEHAIDENTAGILVHVVSLLGFLSASAKHAEFWTAEERLELIQSLRMALSEGFMVTLGDYPVHHSQFSKLAAAFEGMEAILEALRGYLSAVGSHAPTAGLHGPCQSERFYSGGRAYSFER